MRVTDRSTSRNYLKYYNGAYGRYQESVARQASGNRYTKVSDDVSGGSQVLQARSYKYKSEKNKEVVGNINQELSTTETGMQSIKTALTEIHGKIKKAQNDPTGDGRSALVAEIQAIQDEILQFANTKFQEKYVFGGQNVGEAPFSVDDDGKMLYNGIAVDSIFMGGDGEYHYTDDFGTDQLIPRDEDQYLDIGLGLRLTESQVDPNTAIKVTYSGLDILGCGVQRPNETSNNIYNILTDCINNIKDYNKEKLDVADTQLSSLSDKFSENLTEIGAKTNYLDVVEQRLADEVDGYKAKIDQLMGVDTAEESVTQSMAEATLKTVLYMGSNLIPISLMDFLH